MREKIKLYESKQQTSTKVVTPKPKAKEIPSPPNMTTDLEESSEEEQYYKVPKQLWNQRNDYIDTLKLKKRILKESLQKSMIELKKRKLEEYYDKRYTFPTEEPPSHVQTYIPQSLPQTVPHSILAEKPPTSVYPEPTLITPTEKKQLNSFILLPTIFNS